VKGALLHHYKPLSYTYCVVRFDDVGFTISAANIFPVTCAEVAYPVAFVIEM
jgi:hypothetical protein